ncbi:5-oxoprolinase subunit PxpB [Rhizobium sp. SSA_523]|uniref:5-oxoprolinase subunit PxpB n=1 Tax=Rhizobium sp. SSA_523 TaxID=2952477 RepID=UPI0020913B63|nr:5-oxoprolinase subunit PxpB [Rhizobium sp. SSA_523]MCO5731188.1 5-oxoprolinase subunit PxpB [Rhizobium sp. SSA_523]WKC22269.1 5-oxoprolinase subunit PxpB [Rhizobium sp. SSA_523]
MTTTIYPRIVRSGDQALAIEFSDTVSEAANRQVLALDRSLAQAPLPGTCETIPTYRSLTVIYDPRQIRGNALGLELLRRVQQEETGIVPPGRLFSFPVHYGGAHAADLRELAEMKQLSVEAVIDLHLAAEYRVYMIGFAPGFAYLGGLAETLHTPRLAVPRQRIEAGAIGIGGRQTSINSVPGPSGWRFLGRTPYRLFNPLRRDPFLLKAGDRIRFRAIEADEAAALDASAGSSDFTLEPLTGRDAT